jgi:Ras-related protein Rab-8A
MCSVGSSVCAGGAAEADDGESDGAAADTDPPIVGPINRRVGANITLTVNEMGGRKFDMCLPGSSYVSTVKLRLERAGAAPVKQQDLFVGGAEDKCRDDAVLSQLLPDGDVPRVLFLLVRPADPVVPVARDRNRIPFDLQIKLLMIGDACVGKTCLLNTYKHDAFSHIHQCTIGIDFMTKHIELDGKRLKLVIWDTAGQERFRTITTSYFRGALGILLVYDVTNRGSFSNIRNWMAQLQAHADADVNRILVANKCDLVDARVVTTEEGQAMANEFPMQYFEASARRPADLSTLFDAIARQVKDRLLVDGGACVQAAPCGAVVVNAANARRRKKTCC